MRSEGVDQIHLSQDRVQWRVLVNTMSRQDQYKGNNLSMWPTISFSGIMVYRVTWLVKLVRFWKVAAASHITVSNDWEPQKTQH
jgi:hypothetical protein